MLVQAGKAVAQKAQSSKLSSERSYWVPGAVKVLSSGSQNETEKLEDFPDNKEARSWLVGFMTVINDLCPANGQTQANITRLMLRIEFRSATPGLALSRAITEYISEAQPVGPEGSEDARVLAAAGCPGADTINYNIARVIIHKSRNPEPEALPRFLALASSAYRRKLGYTDAQVAAMLYRPPPPPPPMHYELSNQTIFKFKDPDIRSEFGIKDYRNPDALRRRSEQLKRAFESGPFSILVCNYMDDVGNYSFWYQSVPASVPASLKEWPDGPFMAYGDKALAACPKTKAEADRIKGGTAQP